MALVNSSGNQDTAPTEVQGQFRDSQRARINYYSVATPYFNIWIGGPAPDIVPLSSKLRKDGILRTVSSANFGKDFDKTSENTGGTFVKSQDQLIGIGKAVSIREKLKQVLSDTLTTKEGQDFATLIYDLLKSVKEVSVRDSVIQSDTFSIKIIDPNFDWVSIAPQIFNLGDCISIELGYTEPDPVTGQAGFENKLTGRITAVNYNIPDDGVPVLTIQGMNYTEYITRMFAKLDPVKDKKLMEDNLVEFVISMATRIGLKADETTVFLKSDAIKKVPPSILNKLNQYSDWNVHQFLSFLGGHVNAIFYVKGTTVYFFDADLTHTRDADFNIDYRTGIKNLLNFELQKIGQETAAFTMGGYDEGGKTQSKKSLNSVQLATDAFADNPSALSQIEEQTVGKGNAGKFGAMNQNEVTNNTKLELDETTGKLVRTIIPSIKKGPVVQGTGNLSQEANEHARRLLYFVDATARILGDIHIRAGKKVAAHIVGEDYKPIRHNGISGTSIDGPWYVHEVMHTVNSDTGYTSDLTLKKFWDVLPLTRVQDAVNEAREGFKKGLILEEKKGQKRGTVTIGDSENFKVRDHIPTGGT